MDYISTLANMSGVFAVLAAIFYYFGKVISETKVEKFEKSDMIIQGFFFTLFFLIIPAAIIFVLFQNQLVFSIGFVWLLLGQIVISYAFSHFYIVKTIEINNLDRATDRLAKKRIAEIKKSHKRFSKLITEDGIMSIFHKSRNAYVRILQNNYFLFLLCLLMIYSIASLFATEFDMVDTTFISVFTFLNLTLIAYSYGVSSAYHPPARLTLTNGQTIEGKAIKFGEFATVLVGEKKYFINKDHILHIEESIWKKGKKI